MVCVVDVIERAGDGCVSRILHRCWMGGGGRRG